VQYPYFFFAVMTTSATYDLSDGHAQPGPGKFSLKVFDVEGNPFYSPPINTPADCSDIIAALESLPNNVMPKGFTKCNQATFNRVNPLEPNNSTAFAINYHSLYLHYGAGLRTLVAHNKPASIDTGYEASFVNASATNPLLSGDLYFVQFFGHAGAMKQPEIETYLRDGTRPSLLSAGGRVVTKSWSNGQLSTNIDYFPYHCAGVQVRVSHANGLSAIFSISGIDKINACLGEADNDPTNNLAVNVDGSMYEYDLGTKEYPHLIRLVKSQQDSREGGYLGAVYFESQSHFEGQTGTYLPTTNQGAIQFLHPFVPSDDNDHTLYDLYTTNGVLKRIQPNAVAEFDFGKNHVFVRNLSRIDGELSCEALGAGDSFVNTSTWNCIDTNDHFVLLDSSRLSINPPLLNLYAAQSVRKVADWDLADMGELHPSPTNSSISRSGFRHLITSDYNMNWASQITSGGNFQVYKFSISEDNGYRHISECSNRGLCNTFEGICECFDGYTGEACQTQSTVVT
jgi:hypothetical protein